MRPEALSRHDETDQAKVQDRFQFAEVDTVGWVTPSRAAISRTDSPSSDRSFAGCARPAPAADAQTAGTGRVNRRSTRASETSFPRRRAADHGRGLRVKTVDLIGPASPGHVLGPASASPSPWRRRHGRAACAEGLGRVCILAPREPASTGATGRDGRGRGNRLGAAVAARSGPAQRRARPGRAGAGRRVAMPPLGGCLEGHLEAPLSPTQVLGFLAEPTAAAPGSLGSIQGSG